MNTLLAGSLLISAEEIDVLRPSVIGGALKRPFFVCLSGQVTSHLLLP